MTLLDSVHRVLDPAARSSPARLLRAIHLFVVVTGVAAVILGSVPEVMADHGAAIAVVIDAALVFFLADYAARLAVAPRHRRADRNRPWAARLAWAVSAWGLVDVCAVLPLPLARLAGFDPATADLFGILWVLKLSRYSPGLGMLGRVLRNEREPLLSVSLFFVKVLLTAATLGYLFERTRQPDSFGTIPDTLWWTIATLTTTGYGDEVPATVAGRILGGLVMVCGIGVFALWAGILATGFAQEQRRREFLKTWDLVAKVPFFRDIGAAAIAEIARLLRPRAVGPGTVVVRRGEAGDCMYFIVEGEIEVQIDPPLRLGAGSFFGEIALITGAPRSATAVAVAHCTMLVLDIVDFRQFAAHNPVLDQAIRDEAERRLGGAGVSATR